MSIIAQEAVGSPLDFVQYGVLGLIIVALLLGWLWAKPAVDRILADKARAEEQRDDLLRVYEEKVMPALLESTRVVSALKPVMEEVVQVLDQVRRDQRG